MATWNSATRRIYFSIKQIKIMIRRNELKLCLSVLILTTTFPLFAAEDKSVPSETTIWFDKPATDFTESSPLGNGRLGAMMFGGVDEERIVLNESSVWSGSRQNVLSVSNTNEVVLLIAAGTDYQSFAGRQTKDPLAATLDDLNKAAKKSCTTLRKALKTIYKA
jgi:hypothetical protein